MFAPPLPMGFLPLRHEQFIGATEGPQWLSYGTDMEAQNGGPACALAGLRSQ